MVISIALVKFSSLYKEFIERVFKEGIPGRLYEWLGNRNSILVQLCLGKLDCQNRRASSEVLSSGVQYRTIFQSV